MTIIIPLSSPAMKRHGNPVSLNCCKIDVSFSIKSFVNSFNFP